MRATFKLGKTQITVDYGTVLAIERNGKMTFNFEDSFWDKLLFILRNAACYEPDKTLIFISNLEILQDSKLEKVLTELKELNIPLEVIEVIDESLGKVS